MKTIPLLASLLVAISASPATAAPNMVDLAKKTAAAQIHNLVDPVLDKYCHDECKMLYVEVAVDIATPDEVAPGFDDVEVQHKDDLAPSSAQIKILISDQVGPVSRTNLINLLQQYLDTLDYPVKIEPQVTHFPQPISSISKINDLRDHVLKQVRSTLEELFAQVCPQQCLLGDFSLQTDVVNGEEAQYGSSGEYVQDGDIAIKVKDLTATVLLDDTLSPDERANIIEMAKLKTNYLKNVTIDAKVLKFPHPDYESSIGDGGFGKLSLGLSSEKSTTSNNTSTANNSSSTTQNTLSKNERVDKSSSKSSSNLNESNTRQERFERFEKIERVENGDAIQGELHKFKVYGLIFACSVLSLLIFLAMASYRPKGGGLASVQRVIQNLASDPVSNKAPAHVLADAPPTNEERMSLVTKRYEIERLVEELMAIFAQQPKVAKQVFSRIITEEGVEVTAQYVHIFGESIVMDMLRDPSLQSDLQELMEYYAKNPIELNDEEKLELLKKLHNRTVTGKLLVMGNRSSNLFDFLSEMDGMQILELIRNESLTVKSIVLTQVDPQKRSAIYAQLDEATRMKLLTELSRIDYLPRDYIFNVSNALKRKKRENPRLNTEALPGSEVLVNLLERTGRDVQSNVIKNLEMTNPENARLVKSKLVSLDTLRYLRDGQLLEVVLSLRHDELLQFLKGTTQEIRTAVFSKSPKELIVELEEELGNVQMISRETYQAVERKVLNRMKMMANEGLLNLVEVNERMFADQQAGTGFIEAGPGTQTNIPTGGTASIRKVGGW